MKSDGERELREERKKDHREKKCLAQNKCAIIFIARVFWGGKKTTTTTRFSENCTPVIYFEDGSSRIGSIRI